MHQPRLPFIATTCSRSDSLLSTKSRRQRCLPPPAALPAVRAKLVNASVHAPIAPGKSQAARQFGFTDSDSTIESVRTAVDMIAKLSTPVHVRSATTAAHSTRQRVLDQCAVAKYFGSELPRTVIRHIVGVKTT